MKRLQLPVVSTQSAPRASHSSKQQGILVNLKEEWYKKINIG
jgi:hypothetical protein